MGRFTSLRRTLGGFMPPPPDPVIVRDDEGVADTLRHLEILGRLIFRHIGKLEKQMADQNYTTQQILDAVTAERSQIGSLSTLIGGIKDRLNAALAGQISPSAQAQMNEIMSEIQGNSRAILNATLNNDDDPTNDVDANGNPITPTKSGSAKAATTTTLSSSKPIANVGEEVTLSAGVSAATGIDKAVTGSVVFSTEAGAVGRASLDSTGVAAMTTTVPAGDHSITATYSGDDSFAPSTSEPITQSALAPNQSQGEVSTGAKVDPAPQSTGGAQAAAT